MTTALVTYIFVVAILHQDPWLAVVQTGTVMIALHFVTVFLQESY